MTSLPKVAFDGLDKVKITVSSASSSASSMIPAMLVVPEILPGFIVSVPFGNV